MFCVSIVSVQYVYYPCPACIMIQTHVSLDHCLCFNREGGGVGDASIRKTAYFEGAQDPTLYGKVYTNSHEQ